MKQTLAPEKPYDKEPGLLDTRSRSAETSDQCCETCARLLRLVKSPCTDEITFHDVPQLLRGSGCKVHGAFLRWFQVLSTAHFVSLEDDSQKPAENSHLRITNSSHGIVRLDSTPGCNLSGDLLIARTGSDGRDPAGIARIVDRKWIDPNLIKAWKTSCESEHGIRCSPVSNNRSNLGNFPRPPLPLLIDTVEECLVDGTDKAAYVCLSYVWGIPIVGQELVRTTTETLHKFRQPGALCPRPDGILLPRTLRDAMCVTRLLGERYLWVDALCIVQDDDSVRYSLINNMHAVYANAALTIIAADGEDADAGLNGLRGLSPPVPRDNPCVFEWPDGTTLNWPASSGLDSTIWNERGWTFQEYLFSRKRLIFVADSVRWECHNGCFWEEHTDPGQLPTPETQSAYEPDNTPIRQTAGATSAMFPDMVAFSTLVTGFSRRQFTYPDDVMDGFAGVLSALAPTFPGGFIWGVPVMYLDLALTWRANLYDPMSYSTLAPRRRWDPWQTVDSDRNVPTWSWASYHGGIETALIWTNEDWLLLSRNEWFYNVDSIRRIIPLLRWSLRESKHTDDAMVDNLPGQNAWYALKTKYTTTETPPAPPPGWTSWPIKFKSDADEFSLISDIDIRLSGSRRASHLNPTRDRFPPRYYYTHELTGSSKFFFPVPIRDEKEAERSRPSKVANVTSGRYLCASTHRTFFNIEIQDNEDYPDSYELFYLEHSEEKKRVGRLWPDEPLGDDYKSAVLPLEFVVISAKYRANGGERWEQPLGKERPQLYNVLWIEWLDGVAYRRGIGEVEKTIWDTQPLEPIELVLG